MVVSVWFGFILFILFTIGIIDEWKRGGSANKMSIAEQEKYWKGECKRRNEEYRESKKIDKHLYHELYLACKANQYKSKKNLADAVEKIIYKKGLEQKTAAQKQAIKDKK